MNEINTEKKVRTIMHNRGMNLHQLLENFEKDFREAKMQRDRKNVYTSASA